MESRSQGLRKGTWTADEDRLLRKCIDEYGEGKWHLVPARAGLNRCRKSCRLRWLNYLKPDIKRGRLSSEEVDLLIRLHKLLGNRWSLIAGRLPGRTANDVKNYWNTHLSKKHDRSICKNIIEPALTPPTESVQHRVEVIKPRPRSFTNNNHRRLLHGTSLKSVSPAAYNNNIGSTSSTKKDDIMHMWDNGEVMGNDRVVDHEKDSTWWENLLEESEEDAAETSWMNSAAMAFDVDLWNSFIAN